MNRNYTIAIVLTLFLFLMLLWLFRTPKLQYPGPNPPRTVTTAPFDVLKKVAQEKVQQVRDNSGIFQPYNRQLMDMVENAINNATQIDNLALALMLMPNNSIGTYPLVPLKNPVDSTLFQFEQGTLGWYWGYATYPDKKLPGNIMYYIIRIELGTPEIRAKYNLPLGSTTVYSISMGQGVNKNWVYSPFIVTGGKYEMTDDRNFKFSAQSPKGSLALESTDITGGFKVNMSWDKYSSLTTFQPEQPIAPSFNGENGCAPCVAGAGTLYWSYTQLPSSSTINGINIDGKSSHEFTNGDGWLDRQWLRGNDTKQLFVTILTNIKQLSTATGGLGRYIWINIHLKDGTQYMISAFPDPNKTVQAGTTYPARFNIYSEKHAKPLWNQDTKLTIKKTKVVDGVTFPIENEIEVRDFDGKSHTYTIDATMYGDCVTLDLTGNLHWSGSAELIGGDGTAFLEANQFEEAKDYQLTMMKIAGIPANQQSVFNKGPLTFWQVLPSIAMLVIPVILFIAIIVFVVKGVRSKQATFKR